MAKTVLMQGNEAVVEGAIRAGMRFYAGYPITPSTEIAEQSAVRLPQVGGRFIQMEDELGSMACAIGASVAGTKAMTATSGPGFSLKQENIGYACMTEIPVVIVDVQRFGPSTGLATNPAQGDVMQARWGTHGDHPIIAISPGTVEECYKLAIRCFNLSEKYRQPVILLMDEMVGHLREGITIPEDGSFEIINRTTVENPDPKRPAYLVTEGELVPTFAPFGQGQRYNVTGLVHKENGFTTNSTDVAEKLIDRLVGKIEQNRDDIVEVEQIDMEDADVAIFCYGGTYRAALEAQAQARAKGIKCGIFRPITIWPFCDKELAEAAKKLKKIVVAEHNLGQLVHEVERVTKGCCEISFVSGKGGKVLVPEQILAGVEK